MKESYILAIQERIRQRPRIPDGGFGYDICLELVRDVEALSAELHYIEGMLKYSIDLCEVKLNHGTACTYDDDEATCLPCRYRLELEERRGEF